MAAQRIQLESTSPLSAQSQSASVSDAANNNNATGNNNNGEGNDEGDNRRGGAARGGIEAVNGALPAGQELPGDANIANNNQPGDDAVGAALNRDWLDIFDMLSRIVVLSSIVYFYSSPSRFLIVTFLGFAIYLWASFHI